VRSLDLGKHALRQTRTADPNIQRSILDKTKAKFTKKFHEPTEALKNLEKLLVQLASVATHSEITNRAVFRDYSEEMKLKCVLQARCRL
jgi:succinate dehydrogenase hydrophobic anchor subunit